MNGAKVSYPVDGYNLNFKVEDQSFWYRIRNKVILHTIKQYSSPGTFLDLGAGNGYTTLFLQQNLKDDVLLIEPGVNGCKNAQSRGVKNIFNGFFDDYQDQFNNVGIFDVLEHIEDDQKFLTKIYDRLPTNGTINLTVPSFNFLRSSDDDFTGHYRRYTLRELRKKLERSGFTFVYGSYFFSPLLPIIFLFRTIPYRLGSKITSSDTSIHQRTFMSSLLEAVLDLEFIVLQKLGYIPVGSSIIVVAKK